MYKIPVLIIFLLMLTTYAYSRNNPEEIQIGMEVLNISKFDLATGKYNVEFVLYLKYSDIPLPKEIDFDLFQECLQKINDEVLKDELMEYYKEDKNYYIYVLKDNLKKDDLLAAYEILKTSGYYDTVIPFELLNGTIEKNDKNGKYKIQLMDLEENNETFIYYKVNAEITTFPGFKNFPFDKQDLSIKIANYDLLEYSVFKTMDDYIMLPEQIDYTLFQTDILNKLNSKNKDFLLTVYELNQEKTGYELKDDINGEDEEKIKSILNSINFNTMIYPEVKIPGWELKEGKPFTAKDSYMKEKFSTFIFPMKINRNPVFSFIKIFLPMFLIVISSFFSLFVGTTVVGNRLAVIASLLLSCVVLHLNCTSSLPQIGSYLTLADKFFIASYVSLTLNLLFTVLIINQNDKKCEEGVKKAYRHGVFIVPGLTVFLYLLIITGIF